VVQSVAAHRFRPDPSIAVAVCAPYAILRGYMASTGDTRAGGLAVRPGAPPAIRTAPDNRNRLRPDDGRLIRGRKSRARIRAAARALFDERGFDNATLRAIAERAGMGASSIYRHVRSKEELLIHELDHLQEEAWRRFREGDDRRAPTVERVRAFLDHQHALLVEDRDLTMIALRATTKPQARVARQTLALNDRTIGLLFEILQMGRMRKDLARDVDVLEAARVIFHLTQGARISWANDLVDADTCRKNIQAGVDLLFRGLASRSVDVAPGARPSAPAPVQPG
jgi:AcrR family transcriptional regulator